MRELLVFGEKTFRIKVPVDAKLTFGPWSVPSKGNHNYDEGSKKGTLRVYQGTKDNIIACFSGVNGFRDLSLDYTEQVVVEEGAAIWKSDHNGYEREDKRKVAKKWVNDQLLAAPKPQTNKTKRGK